MSQIAMDMAKQVRHPLPRLLPFYRHKMLHATHTICYHTCISLYDWHSGEGDSLWIDRIPEECYRSDDGQSTRRQ